MSRMYFSTVDETAEVKGWERAWLGGLVQDVALGVFDLDDHTDELLQLVNPQHYASKYRDTGANIHQVASMLGVALRTDMTGDATAPRGESLFLWRGKPLSAHGLVLNTAVAVGNDAVKLAARLHAQSEIHAWIHPRDRVWVAEIIEQAVATGIYRDTLRTYPLKGQPAFVDEPSGWRDVIALLRSDLPGPVVTHYSITDEFPNRRVAEVPFDVWEDLDAVEQWRLAFESLSIGAWSRRLTGLRIMPDDWQSFRFHHNLTAFDLYAGDMADRLDAALGTRP